MKITRKEGVPHSHIKRVMEDIARKRLSVGFFPEAKYEDGTPVAYVAAIQEFGTDTIPARPFMRPTISENRTKWVELIRKGFKAAMAGRVTITQVYGQVGMSTAGDVSRTISQVTTPPLSAATIAARQGKRKTPSVSTKPLVDTGLLIQSVTSQVQDK
jgi:HK97 gp10 family phage protein